METRQFEGIMIVLAPALIEACRNETSATFTEALHDVYTSKLYRVLEDPATGVWHFSAQLLSDLLV